MLDKIFGWECKWKFERRFTEWDFNKYVYEIYKDYNKNWLVRYKKILLNESPPHNCNMWFIANIK